MSIYSGLVTIGQCEELKIKNEAFRMVLYEILYHYIAIASTNMWSLKDN